MLVAGIGFLTDAYDVCITVLFDSMARIPTNQSLKYCGMLISSFAQIFSINTIIPMLSIIYWEGGFPAKYQHGMNIATLLGSMLGQVTFGILADRYGRRKMYGLELIVTIAASLGLATASTGVHNSMSIIGLLIFWRLIMGIGIGAVRLSQNCFAFCTVFWYDVIQTPSENSSSNRLATMLTPNWRAGLSAQRCNYGRVYGPVILNI